MTKEKYLHLRISEYLLTRLEEKANKMQMTKSELVRQILLNGVDDKNG